jgi:apolipoprotein N-acyltransferase
MLIALAAGALHAWPMGRADLWWLQPMAVAALLAVVADARPGRAAWLGGCFSTAWLVAAVWWLFISMHRYGGLAAPLAALAVLALAVALSLYLAAALAWAAHRTGAGRAAPLGAALVFSGAWLSAELARGLVFTGFPWAASGYAHVEGPLAAWAPWIGVYGIGALATFGAACVVFGWRAGSARTMATRRAWGPAAATGVVVAVVAAAGAHDFGSPGATLRVALLQTNVAQDQKFSTEAMPEALERARRALLDARADLVVGPETVIPLLPDQLESFVPGYWATLVEHFSVPGRHALVGRPMGSYEEGYTNSVIGLGGPASDAAGAAGGARQAHGAPTAPYRYDKHHLVPFGEFIPRGFRWFTEMMHIPLGDFARGPLAPPSFEVRVETGGVERVAPNICYEDLFGEELAARFADADAAPGVLANVSNIGWFGPTVAIPQHLQISRMRTLELQRPMLRSTNTGATAVIDHRGVVTHALPPHTRGVLEGTVQARRGVTPYAAWAARWGLWPLIGLAAALMLLPLRQR